MDKIFRLSNGIRVAVIGNIYPAIFDDNLQLTEEIHSIPETFLECSKFNVVDINTSKVSIAFGKNKLSDWVYKDIDILAKRFADNEIDVIVTNLGIVNYVLHYIMQYYPNMPLHSPVISEYEDNIPVFKIDSFIALI